MKGSEWFCKHRRLLTRDCDDCDLERDDILRAEGRRDGLEEAAKVCEMMSFGVQDARDLRMAMKRIRAIRDEPTIASLLTDGEK